MTKVTLLIRGSPVPKSAQERAQHRAKVRELVARGLIMSETEKLARSLSRSLVYQYASRGLADMARDALRDALRDAMSVTGIGYSIAEMLERQYRDAKDVIRYGWRDALDCQLRDGIESDLIERGIDPRRARRIADAPTVEIAEARADAAYRKDMATGGLPLRLVIRALYERAAAEGIPVRQRAGWIEKETGYNRSIIRRAYAKAIAEPPTT